MSFDVCWADKQLPKLVMMPSVCLFVLFGVHFAGHLIKQKEVGP